MTPGVLSRAPRRTACSDRISDILVARPRLLLLCSSRRRCSGSASSISARCSRCCRRASSRSTNSRARSSTSSTLEDLCAALAPANLDIIVRTLVMSAVVTLACRDRRLSDRLLRRALRARLGQGAVLSRGDDAAVVELSRQGLCLEAACWPRRASSAGSCEAAGIFRWLLDGILALPLVGGPSLSVSYTGMVLSFLYLWTPFMILPLQAALERVPATLIEASDDSAPSPGRRSARDPAAGAAGPRRRLDLHLLADARRLHRAADRRPLLAHSRPGRLHPAGHRRKHSARGRLLRRADRRSWASSCRSPSAWGRSMRSERPAIGARRPARRSRIAAAAGLAFLHLPLAFILLYAFSTEDRSFQFPPPGLHCAGSASPGTGPTSGRRWRCRSASRSSSTALALHPRHARRRGAVAREVLRPRGDLAAVRPADRAARHRHRHCAALRLQPHGHPLLVSGRSCSATPRSASSSSTTTPSPASAACRRRWSRRRWISAPTASRPSATSSCRRSARRCWPAACSPSRCPSTR